MENSLAEKSRHSLDVPDRSNHELVRSINERKLALDPTAFISCNRKGNRKCNHSTTQFKVLTYHLCTRLYDICGNTKDPTVTKSLDKLFL